MDKKHSKKKKEGKAWVGKHRQIKIANRANARDIILKKKRLPQTATSAIHRKYADRRKQLFFSLIISFLFSRFMPGTLVIYKCPDDVALSV